MAVNKPFYVVDASVIVKWFFNEAEDQSQALAIKDDCLEKRIELGVPHYTLAEILNFFGRNSKSDTAISCFSLFLTFGVEIYPVTLELASMALQIMSDYGTQTFYDAGYHALALQSRGIFVTADKKYVTKTHKEGGIMLLKDYGKKR